MNAQDTIMAIGQSTEDHDPRPDAVTLSQGIEEAFAGNPDGITIGELLDHTRSRGFGFLLAVLAVPVAIPFTPPGLSTPFGVLTIGLAWQLLMNRDTPWFPQRFLQRRMPGPAKSKFVSFMIRFVRFFERFLKKRHEAIFRPRIFRTFVAPTLVICGIGMLIPAPGASWLPSMGVFLIGLGMLEDDGGFGYAGLILGWLGTAIVVTVMVLLIMFGADEGLRLYNEARNAMMGR